MITLNPKKLKSGKHVVAFCPTTEGYILMNQQKGGAVRVFAYNEGSKSLVFEDLDNNKDTFVKVNLTDTNIMVESDEPILNVAYSGDGEAIIVREYEDTDDKFTVIFAYNGSYDVIVSDEWMLGDDIIGNLGIVLFTEEQFNNIDYIVIGGEEIPKDAYDFTFYVKNTEHLDGELVGMITMLTGIDVTKFYALTEAAKTAGDYGNYISYKGELYRFDIIG